MATVQGLDTNNDDDSDALIGTVNAAGGPSSTEETTKTNTGQAASTANTLSTAGGGSTTPTANASQSTATLNQSGSEGGPAGGGNSISTSGGATAANTATNAGSGGATGSPSTQAPNGGVVDLNQYLSGNANQVGQLANSVQNWLQQQGTNAQNTVNTNIGQFNNAVQQGTVNEDTGLVNSAVSNPIAFVGSSTATNPNANLAQFLAEENATYTGPQSFETSQYYAPSSQAVNQATTYGNDIGNQTGLAAILQAMNHGQSPNPLDASLLASTPSVQAALKQGQGYTSNLTQYLNNAAQQADAAATQAGLTTQQTQQAVQKAISDAYNTFQTNVQGEVTNAQNIATTNNAALQALLTSGGTPTAQQLQQLGITADQYNQLVAQQNQYNSQYGAQNGNVSLASYLSNPTPVQAAINPNNVATQQDYATQSALALLNPNAGWGNYITTPNAAATAPTYNSNFNYQEASTGLQNDLAAAAQAAQENANQQAANYHAQKAAAQANNPLSGGNLIKTATTVVSAVVSACSDRRLKYNIKWIGHENGHKIYTFKYIWNPFKTYIGVMAQDILKTNPDAVEKKYGFYRVFYNLLGVDMRVVN